MNKKVIILICFVVCCLTAIPAFAGYLYEGERITDWLAIGGTALEWQLLIVAIQILTLVGTRGMFRELYGAEHSEAAFWGMLLYLTCPARVYAIFDEENVPLTLYSAVLPIVVWIIAALWRRFGRVIGSVAVTVGVAGCVVVGTVSLFTIQSEERSLYTFGEWLHLLIYSNGHPGLGYGLAVGLLACVWLVWIERDRMRNAVGIAFLIVGLLGILLTMWRLPWASITMLALLAQFCLCVPATEGILRLRRNQAEWLSVSVPFLALTACVSQTIYTCNMLLYTRTPLLQ